MKICILVNSLGQGGAERVIQTLSNHWADQGHMVVLATLHDLPVAYDFDPKIRILPLSRAGETSGMTRLAALPALARKWSDLLSHQNPTHALSVLPRANLVNCLSRSFGNERTLVLSERTATQLEYDGLSPGKAAMRLLIRRLYPRAHRIIAISSGVKASLSAMGIPEAKIAIVSNPQNLSLIRSSAHESLIHAELKDKPRLVHAARLTDVKDQATLLRAFQHLRETVDAQLVIMGEGPLRGELERMATVLGVEKDVWFAGWQSNPFALMRQCQIYVHSSRHEGFGNALIEAMACGLPVVATACPGGAEDVFCPEQRKYLVAVGDAAGLADRVTDLLSDPTHYRWAQELSERRSRAFSVTAIAPRYEALSELAPQAITRLAHA